jgi:hypothetical protein
MFRQIRPGEKIATDVSFAVDNVNRKFWLTFYDRKNSKVITKVSVDNAYRKIPEKSRIKNAKVRTKKRSYKKDDDFMELDF